MIADTLNVHPKALSVPDIDASISTQQGLYDALEAWHKQSVQLENRKISKQEYDEWRYHYPHSEADRNKNQLKDKNEM